MTDAIGTVIINHCVVGNTGIPNMGGAQFLNALQCFIGKIGEFAHAVFFQRAPRFIGGILVTE